MSTLARITRKITAAACHLHALALVRVADLAYRDEQAAADELDARVRLSRWANEQKKLAAERLTAATRHADTVAEAVNEELARLPFGEGR